MANSTRENPEDTLSFRDDIEDRFLGELKDVAILLGIVFLAGFVFLISVIVLVLKWWP